METRDNDEDYNDVKMLKFILTLSPRINVKS